MSNEMPSDAELLQQLHEENADQEKQIESLREQLARAESLNIELSAILDTSAENLQRFGAMWVKPSSVRSINYQMNGGIHIDGIPIQMDTSLPTQEVATEMQRLADQINGLNAQRRARAKSKGKPR